MGSNLLGCVLIRLQGTILNPGTAKGEAVLFDDPLSFWGGFDAVKGQVIDKQHPQYGVVITGKVLVMPGSRGSAGTPGVLAESLRLKTGPIGIILDKPDINVTTGALVVSELYNQHCPVIALGKDEFTAVKTATSISIEHDGRIEFTSDKP